MSPCHFEPNYIHETDAYFFVQYFDLLHTDNLSLDNVDETINTIRFRWSRNQSNIPETKPGKYTVSCQLNPWEEGFTLYELTSEFVYSLLPKYGK